MRGAGCSGVHGNWRLNRGKLKRNIADILLLVIKYFHLTASMVAMEADLQGPGHVFLPFLVMEDLLDKLKLLDYDIQFVAELRMRPLTRHYFVLQTNPGEQFFMFTSLAAWLVGIEKYFMSCSCKKIFHIPYNKIHSI